MNAAVSGRRAVTRGGRVLRWLGFAILVLAAGLVTCWLALRAANPLAPDALEQHHLRDARVVAERRLPGGDLRQDIELRCTCGRKARLLVRLPAAAGRHPLALMLGGFETGRRAVDLVPKNEDWVIAALDYPETGPLRGGLAGRLRSISHVRAALRHVVPSIRISLDELLARRDVDPTDVQLVGVSLGTIFVIPAAVTDRRVKRLWLMDGAAEIPRVMSRALQGEIPNRILRWLAVRAMYELAYGPRFEPGRWLPRLAPREVIMVNSREDRRMPAEAVKALHEAARRPKRVIWLPGRHVLPSRTAALRALASVFFSEQGPEKKEPGVGDRPPVANPQSPVPSRQSSVTSPQSPGGKVGE